MSCAGCNTKEDGCKVSLTPNVHEGLCPPCFGAWVEYAMDTKVWRNTLASIVTAFRRWCADRAKVAA